MGRGSGWYHRKAIPLKLISISHLRSMCDWDSSKESNANRVQLLHFSPENRETCRNGGERVLSSSLGKNSGPLGEALCHSQTRARKAERQAERTFQDYQKISHLFFREASLSLTYRLVFQLSYYLRPLLCSQRCGFNLNNRTLNIRWKEWLIYVATPWILNNPEAPM